MHMKPIPKLNVKKVHAATRTRESYRNTTYGLNNASDYEYTGWLLETTFEDLDGLELVSAATGHRHERR